MARLHTDELTERARRRFLRDQPLSRLFPNLITIAGLCCGLSAIRFAILGKWEHAVAFIIAAALIDGMDGRIARMLGATSVFGAQLDSLSDFLCFGVAPVLVMYMFQLHEVKGVGWAMVLFFAVCCALRLARFNTVLQSGDVQPWQKRFFTGIPSPAGGILCMWPLVLNLQFGDAYTPPAIYSLLHVFVIAVLMASRVPTFAAKHMRIKPDLILPVTIALAFIVVMFIIETWLAVALLSLAYLAHIPISVRYYRSLKQQHAPAPAPTATGPTL